MKKIKTFNNFINEKKSYGIIYDLPHNLEIELQKSIGDIYKITPYVLEYGNNVKSNVNDEILIYEDDKLVKKFKTIGDFLSGIGYRYGFKNENVEFAEPKTRPTTKPTTKPTTTPNRPTPFRRDKPSVIPKPKASAEEVADKFIKLTKGDKEIEKLLMKKYSKNITEKFMGDKGKGKISIDLSGPEGNAFAIMGLATRLCKQLKDVDPEKYDIERILEEMMSGDYKNLVNLFEEYFGDFVDIYINR